MSVATLISVSYSASRVKPPQQPTLVAVVPDVQALHATVLTSTTTSFPSAVTEPISLLENPLQVASKRIIPSPSHVASNTADLAESESEYKIARATVFWVGERGSDENGFIHNRASAWDEAWEVHFGGLDDPEKRCGYQPCTFSPKENPFYVALPYNDLDDEGNRKSNSFRIPWYDPELPHSTSILKNRWVEVRTPEATCYAQWEDVGPFEQDDFEYVFGDAINPLNLMGERAGVDLSPALATCLKVDGLGTVKWRHVAHDSVPEGPWRATITTRP